MNSSLDSLNYFIDDSMVDLVAESRFNLEGFLRLLIDLDRQYQDSINKVSISDLNIYDNK